ncbi:MAG: DUF4215 domain-containing protein [Sandaracinaceae bacterium]
MTSVTSTGGYSVNFRNYTGGPDQAFEIGFFVRGAGGTAETRLAAPDTATYAGSVMTMTYLNAGGTGLGVTIVGTLSSSSTTLATLSFVATVTNAGVAAAPLELFAYVDYDVAAGASTDSATLVAGLPAAQILVTDSTSTARMTGVGVTHYQVQAWAALRNALTDTAVTTLADTGLPFGPGDFSGAFQWSLSVPAAGTATASFSAEITSPPPPPTCGDGTVTAPETCDDGFTDACGTCNATCDGPGTGSTCGDGAVCAETEMCDDGYTDACGTCNATCDAAGAGSTCGDGMVCPETETCDEGGTEACGTCNATCDGAGVASVCGDGVVCSADETCDDGFTDACGTCNSTCDGAGTGSTCGDLTVCPETEMCDDGYTDACGTCNATCDAAGTGSTCGDGMVCMETEMCDDGNMADNDGCSMTCMMESDAGMPMVDAGPMVGDDAGPMTGSDAGPMTGSDAGPMTGSDGGRRDGGTSGADAGDDGGDGGCSCRVQSSSRAPRGLLVAFAALGLVVWRRRRRG